MVINEVTGVLAMDQLLPFLFALVTLLVVVRIAFDPGRLERDRHVRNTDLSRPRA